MTSSIHHHQWHGAQRKEQPIVDDTDCTVCVAQSVLLPTVDGEAARLSAEELAARLATTHPLTVENFRRMPGGLTSLQYVVMLDERWQRIARGELPTADGIIVTVPTVRALPTIGENNAFDLIYAGGVLGLFSAAVMARKGFSVMVFDQRQVGTSHREWNISDEELQQFVEAGLFTREELEQAVANRYERGLVRFYSGNIPERPADLWLDHVLDVAIDLGKLLEMARRKFIHAGGKILNFRAFKKVYVTEGGPVRSVVELENEQGEIEHYGARLLINAMGSISPLSLALMHGKPFDGVCPTVGTTVKGFKRGEAADEIQNGVGDVLVTIAHAQQERQLIWEGFAGKDDEVTVYLFYYDLVKPELAAKQSLIDLFEQYFELLPTYKKLDSEYAHLKPVYGFIPARHHRQKMGAVARRGILSVGDATAPQSSLTFCGFGSQVRNLPRLTKLLEYVLRYELLEAHDLQRIGAHQININMMWVFSRFMQPSQPHKRPNDVNRIMNAFCATLAKLDKTQTRRFFQDKVHWRGYNSILLGSARRYPRVFPLSLEVLGWRGLGAWLIDYARFSREAWLCSLYRTIWGDSQNVDKDDDDDKGKAAKLFERVVKFSPGFALRLKARYEEWRACGWL